LGWQSLVRVQGHSEVTLNFLIGALPPSRCAYLLDIISEQKLDSR